MQLQPAHQPGRRPAAAPRAPPSAPRVGSMLANGDRDVGVLGGELGDRRRSAPAAVRSAARRRRRRRTPSCATGSTRRATRRSRVAPLAPKYFARRVVGRRCRRSGVLEVDVHVDGDERATSIASSASMRLPSVMDRSFVSDDHACRRRQRVELARRARRGGAARPSG